MDPNSFREGIITKCVGSTSVHPIYNKRLELVENRLYAHLDDSTLLFAGQQTDLLLLPSFTGTWQGFMSGAGSGHWCMILNPNKTKALAVSISWTVNTPHGDLILSGVSPENMQGMKFDRKLTFEDHVPGTISHVAQRIGILRLVKRIFGDTCVLLCCYYAFVLPIQEYVVQD